jgi:protein phosphatase
MIFKKLQDLAAWWRAPGQVKAAGRSHVGRVRTDNEDALLLRPDLGLFAICDGMGGHQGGGEAARLAAATIEEAVAGGEALEAAVTRAHQAICRLDIRESGNSRRPGSTVVALQLIQDHWRLVWVGDSRAWLLRPKKFEQRLEQLTCDHTVVQQMVNWGDLTPEEARIHPDRNRLSQALGMGDKAPVAGVRQGRLEPGLSFLLASDGLCHWDAPEQLATMMRSGEPQAAIDALIACSLAAGGQDNVTCLIVKIGKSKGKKE